ncbi:MAG: multidrug effflux MFS transporter [Trueperaceae bacterium]
MNLPPRTSPNDHPASARKLSPLTLLAVVGSLMTMSALATDVMLPAFPAMAAHFSVDEATIQLVVSVFMVGYALPQLLIGSLADRFGRRKVLVGGLAVYFAGSVICLLAPSLTMLLVGRVVQGLGCATGPILSRAVLRDLYSGAQLARMMSYAMIVFSAAPLLAPSIGALMIRLWSWESTFVFLLLVAVALTLLVLFVLPETLETPDLNAFKPRSVWRNIKTILSDPRSGWSVAFLTFVYGGLMAYLLASPSIYISHFGLGPEGFAVVFALVATTSLLTQPLNARLLRRYDPQQIAGVALPGYLFAGLLLLVLSLGGVLTLPLFVLSMITFFASFSFVMGNGTTMLLDPHQARAGVASGLMGFLQLAIGTALGTLIARYATADPKALAIGFIVLGLLSYPAFRLALRPRVNVAERLT